MAKSREKKVVSRRRSTKQSSFRPNKQAAVPRQPFESWPRTSTPPANGGLTVFLHGLLSFCYNSAGGWCEVGAYSQSNHHDFKIEIEGGSCNKKTFKRSDLLGDGHTLKLEIASSPYFYMPGTFNRNAGSPPDPQDFRWMLDMEGSDVYGDVTGKQPGFYSPKLLISTGTFYTREKTASTFDIVDLVNGDDDPVGNIAFCMAAYIDIASYKAVLTLKKPRGEERCEFGPGGGPYKIFITNVCGNENDPACKRNDFHHHFASCSPPAGENPLSVELNTKVNRSHSCGKMRMATSDETPCTSAGFGGTPGLP